MRTVVFGVDGLTFRVLHPLMERGDLPNFQRLRQQGCEAVLESKYPPITPAAWTSLSTGLKPARHGVYDFWEYEEGQAYGAARKARVQTRRKGGKAIWNILSEYGKQVLVINVPVTYPPEAVNGVMVSGYLTPSTEVDFTYPTSFKEELFRVVPDYQIDLDFDEIFVGKVSERMNRLIDATLRMTERRIELIMHLLKEKPWDFCYAAFVGADRLQHSLWDEIIGLDRRATEYYRLLDHALGLILEQLGPDDCLFVVSDHGFQGAATLFDINEYLLNKDMLVLGPASHHARSTRSANLKHLLDRIGLLATVRRSLKTLKSMGIWKGRYLSVYKPLLSDIDWERTRAFVPSNSGFGGGYADIFLGPGVDAEGQAELCEDLKRQVNPKTGRPLIDALYTTEVFGQGPYAPAEPHLLLLPTDGVTFRMNLGNKRLWSDTSTTRGTHQKDGVLYAYGHNVKRGFKAPDAEVYDLVPTVLRCMGLPLPYEFDGRVLGDLFIPSERSGPTLQQAANGIEDGPAWRKLRELSEA